MGASIGTNTTASIPALINAVNTIAPQAGLNPQTLLNGITGGGTAGTPGAAAVPGAVASTASTTNAQIQAVQAPTARGTTVTVVKDPSTSKYSLVPATGLEEKVLVDGKQLLFDARGINVRNFEVVARQPIKVDLDQRVGIASGISNLSRIVAQRQERLKAMTEAMAQDSNETGSTNQVDIQQLVQEQQVSENINGLNKKIYDSVQEAVRSWLR